MRGLWRRGGDAALEPEGVEGAAHDQGEADPLVQGQI